jgi:hypothetical protein
MKNVTLEKSRKVLGAKQHTMFLADGKSFLPLLAYLVAKTLVLGSGR